MKLSKKLNSKQVVTQVFFDKKSQGSVQVINVFKTIKSRNIAFDSSPIKLDLDFSFAVFTKSGIDVRWKNKQGEIQFCGSGAFALANFALKYNSFSKTTIYNRYIKVNVRKRKTTFEISFFGLETHRIKNDLFLGVADGIYFKQIYSLKSLQMGNKHLESFIKDKNIDPHGFCLFYFNQKSSLGYVRYFCPWHGRAEDSVTISIHKYLTPLVCELTGIQLQRWRQFSKEGGTLTTSASNRRKKISIGGTYREITDKVTLKKIGFS